MPRTLKKFVRDDAGVDAIGLAALQQVEIHLVEFDQRVERAACVAVGRSTP